jgi:hypothetical protein
LEEQRLKEQEEEAHRQRQAEETLRIAGGCELHPY